MSCGPTMATSWGWPGTTDGGCDMKLPSLRLNVASRIHLSFVLAAALPLFLLAATAYHLVTSRLEQVALEDARQLAKSTGMDVFERLQFLTDQLHMIADYDTAERASLKNLRGLELGERIHGLFDVASTGVTSGHVALSLDEQRVIDDAVQQADGSRPLLLATAAADHQRLFLLVPDETRAAYRFLGAELRLVHLWDTSGVAARPEYVCVLDEHQVPVFCNLDEPAAWLANAAALVERRGRPIERSAWKGPQGQKGRGGLEGPPTATRGPAADGGDHIRNLRTVRP